MSVFTATGAGRMRARCRPSSSGLAAAALILILAAGHAPAADEPPGHMGPARATASKTTEAMRQQVLASVVGIRVYLSQPRIAFHGTRKITAEIGPAPGKGSGVIVDSSGLILTCAHVVGDARKARIFLADELEIEGAVLVADRTSDLALVKVPVDGLTAVDLRPRSRLRHGQAVHLASRPGGSAARFSEATLAAQGAYHVGHSQLEFFRQFLGAIEPGDSGGMLVDETGAFLGILSVGSQEGRLGYAISRELVVAALARLRAGPPVVWPWLGLGVESLSEGAEPNGRIDAGRTGEGARIWTVATGSPGEAAGLRSGDRIVALDGRPVEHFLQAMLTVSSRPVGARFKIEVTRGGEPGSAEGSRVVSLLSAARPLDPALAPLDLFERMTGILLELRAPGPEGGGEGLYVRRAPPPPGADHRSYRSYAVGSRLAGIIPGVGVVRTLEEGRTDQEAPVRTIDELGAALRASEMGDRAVALIHWIKDGRSDIMLLEGNAKRHPFL